MENRYTNTLAEVPATIVEIREVGVPMGFPQKQIKEGFQLCDGSVVVDSMKDANGFYTLRITNTNAFWSSSRYLVVQVK